MATQLGGGSHFLCKFDENGHQNRGCSDDWSDMKKFFLEAIRIAAAKCDVNVDEIE